MDGTKVFKSSTFLFFYSNYLASAQVYIDRYDAEARIVHSQLDIITHELKTIRYCYLV